MIFLTKIGKCSLPWVVLITVAGLLSCAQTRLRLNQVGAESSLKLIRKAQSVYRLQNENRFGTLQELHAAGLIDAELASGTKGGYRYDLRAAQDSYTATAVPVEYDVTGSWSFYLDQSGVIRGSPTRGRTAGVNDPPIRYQ
jgi:competence protein ComGC